MAKLSKLLLKAFFCASANAQDEPIFQVTSCNIDEDSPSAPALSFKIEQNYFENNINDDENNFVLADGFYSRTIPQDELVLAFDTSDDVITLSYTLATESNGFSLNDSTSISFAEESIQFQCRYARTINLNSQMTVEGSQPQPIVAEGDLNYTMVVQVGNLGGTTNININAEHNFDGIAPTVRNCRIHSDGHEVFPIHSFGDDVCFDNSRLNVTQTAFGKDIGLSVRVFRFVDGESSSSDQDQTISCELHLEPIANVPQEQAADCTCYSADECTEYCIRLTSSEDENLCGGADGANGADGGALELVHNGNVIHTFQPLFGSDEKCLRSDQVDSANDVFQIRSTTNDGVCITSLTAGESQVMLNGEPNFWIDGDALPTESYNCNNSEVWSSSMSFKNGQSRGICHSELNEWFDLPDDYFYSQEFWGELYYKSYGEMTADQARSQCEADGASLPVPLSILENNFYADLYPDGQIWLGLTTVHDGSEYICDSVRDARCADLPLTTTTLDGSATGWTNWGDVFIHAENTSADGSYAYIDTRNLSQGPWTDANFWNNNKSDSDLANAICVFKIPRTGCRRNHPGQWTYGWTSQFGSRRWNNFDDAWAACQSIGSSCGSLYLGNLGFEIKSGTGLSAVPHNATYGQHSGAWMAIADTRSTYC